MKVTGVITYLLSALLLLVPVVTSAAPAIPTVTGANSVSQTGFNATWSAVVGAAGYQLDVSTTPLFSPNVSGFSSLDVTNVTTYPVAGLNSGVTYYYRVRAYDGTGTGQNSNTAALITLPATPGVPVTAAATAITQTGFTASWAAIAGAAGYRLDVATDAGFASMVNGYDNLNVGSVITQSVNGLAPGTSYYYRIRAYNNGGTSLSSGSSALVTLQSLPAIPAITGVTFVTQNSFVAAWGAASGATGYRLDVASDSGFSATKMVSGYNNRDVANVSSFNVTGLTSGTTYFYRVRAYNSGGTGLNSTTGALVAQPMIVSAPSVIPAATVTQTDFSAAWGPVVGATGYQLDVATDSLFVSTVPGYLALDVGAATVVSVTGLSPGTTYYYRVRAYDAVGTGVNSTIAAVVTLPAIPGVPFVSATPALFQGGFTATWSPSAGASSYQLDVAADSGFTSLVTAFSNRDVGAVTSYPVTNLIANTTYYYRVRAANNGGVSLGSSPGILVTLPVVPDPPSVNGAVSITQTTFSATWGQTAGATGYYLDVSTSPAFSAYISGYSNLNVANVNSYPVGGLTAGVTYYYRVRATNAGGTSISSIIGVAVTLPATPAVPTTSAATSVTLNSFSANWGSVSLATGYFLDVASDSGFTALVAGNANRDVGATTSVNVTGLQDGTTYFYRVRAYNNGGTSSSSVYKSTTTLPVAPEALAATGISQTGFTANWGSVSGATSYRLDVATDPTFLSILTSYNNKNITGTPVIPLTATATGLTAGTTYYYRVRAVTKNGTVENPGANSNTITLSTIPLAPGIKAATLVSLNSFTANWSAAIGSTGYYVDVATDAAFTNLVPGYANTDVGGVTSVAVTGLLVGVTYNYRVRAYNSGGTSPSSILTSTATLPLAPVAVAATAVSQTGFTANWIGVAGATGYRLDVSSDQTFAVNLSSYDNKDVNTVTTYAVTGLTAGTTYYYRVRAMTVGGNGDSSNSILLTTIPPAPVANTGSAVTQTGFTANWNPASAATGYRLDVSANVGFTQLLAGYNNLDVANATGYAVSGLAAGTTYHYRVRAVNAAGTSGNSLVISQSTLGVPVATAATAITQSGFTATWTAAAGAGGYLLDVASDQLFASILAGYSNLNVGVVTSAPVSGLAPGVTYYYRVRAYTSAATSGNSNVISQITLATPVAASANPVTQTGFTAVWGTVTGATGYALDVASDNGFIGLLPSYTDKKITGAVTASVTGLTAGTTYYYRVRSYNTTATSIDSNIVAVTTVPPAPVATSGTLVTQTGFTVNWAPSKAATGYRLDVATNTTFTIPVTGYSDLDVANVTSYPVSGLSVGATYYYRVRAVNAAGTSGNSNVITQATLTIPTATAASFITQTGFNATWTTAGGATGYRVDVATDLAFTAILSGYNDLDVGNVTSAPIGGLLPGVIYYYRLRAYTSVATTGNSNVISQITLATPVATDAVLVTQNSFKATWQAVAGASGYRLDVAMDPTFASIVTNYDDKNVLNVTSYAVSGLSTGVSYYYRVRAYNATATTVNSNIINPTTFPAVPVASAATSITQTGFVANWVPAAGATGYRLDVATNSVFATFVDGYNDLDVKNVFSQAVNGLTAGTTYYYRVRAYNAGGISVSSAPITQAAVPPAPVATTASVVTQSGFKANWAAANGAGGYFLDVSLDTGFTSILTGYKNLNVANVTSFTVSGLASGTDYYYRVRAFNGGGTGDNSNVISQATLATPVAAAATQIFSTGFTANWGAVNGATTYKLDVSANIAFSSFVTGFKDKDVGLFINAAITGLTPGTVYYYRVRSIRDGATSVNSNVISQATLGTPVAVAATSITQTSFSATWNTALSATSYLLDVAADSAFTTMVTGYNGLDVGTLTSFTVSGLTPGVPYYYRVRAVGSGGVSANSNTITLIMLPPTPAPPVPSSASGIGQYAFTANWNAVSGATGYRLDVAKDEAFTTFVSGYNNRDVGNATSSALTGLLAGTTYYYRLRASNTGGTSASSAIVSLTTLPPTPPAIPVVGAASALTSTGFTATWSAAIGANGYVIDVAVDATFAAILPDYTNIDTGNVSGFAVTGLSSGSVYYYRVRAYNAAGTSTYSEAVAVTTKPAPPRALAAGAISKAGFAAAWDIVSGATGYQVDVSTDAAFSTFAGGYNAKDAGSVTIYPITGLAAGTVYYYRIRAYNSGGVGAVSNTVTVATLPVAPFALAATAVTKTDFNAAWNIVNGAKGYLLDVATDAAFSRAVTGYSAIDTGNVTSLTVSGLNAGTTYYYRVRAYTAGGSGDYSNSIIQATLPPVPPAPVAIGATAITPTGFTALWGAVYGAPGYRIDVSSVKDFSSYVIGYNNFDVGNTSSQDIIGLTPGTTYYFRVRAYNSGGSSENSDIITIVSLPVMLTVTTSGTGSGSVHSSAGNIACTSNPPSVCSASISGGIPVTLSATADSSSLFAGWSGDCSGTADCSVVMDSVKNVTATFIILQPVRIADPVSPRYFDTLQAAYDVAVDGDVIELLDGVLAGNLVADRNVSIQIIGGFDTTFTVNSLETTLQGTLTVRLGAVRVEKVKAGL